MPKYLTPEDSKKIKKELDYLKKIKRKEIAQRLKETSSMGDLTENSAYQEAKDAQGFLEGRILELENLIRESKIVERIEGAQWVQIGSTVVLTPQNSNKNQSTKQSFVLGRAHKIMCSDSKSKTEKYKIVGTGQANPSKGEISIDSPLGKALLNKPEGAIVVVETPQGKIKYKILRVE